MAHRDATHWAIKAARIQPCTRIWVELHYVPATNRRRAPDNLVAYFKPVVDAFVDTGVIPDDTQEFVDRAWPVIDPAEPKRQGGRFYLLVTWQAEDDSERGRIGLCSREH